MGRYFGGLLSVFLTVWVVYPAGAGPVWPGNGAVRPSPPAAVHAAFAVTTRGVRLVPHRAIYRMTLGSASPASRIAGARGAMMYRFMDGCDGWTVENRSYLTIEHDGGEEVESTWSFVSWESKDGLRYRFRVRHTRGGQETEALRGTARLDGPGGAGTAQFAAPSDVTVELPAGTLFPTDHLGVLLGAAQGGGNRLLRAVFDGTTLDNPYEINAVMRATQPGPAAALLARAGLDEARIWKIRLAFFPRASKVAEPEFEIGVRYRDDGIADALQQVFQEFTINLALSEIEILPEPAC